MKILFTWVPGKMENTEAVEMKPVTKCYKLPLFKRCWCTTHTVNVIGHKLTHVTALDQIRLFMLLKSGPDIFSCDSSS